MKPIDNINTLLVIGEFLVFNGGVPEGDITITPRVASQIYTEMAIMKDDISIMKAALTQTGHSVTLLSSSSSSPKENTMSGEQDFLEMAYTQGDIDQAKMDEVVGQLWANVDHQDIIDSIASAQTEDLMEMAELLRNPSCDSEDVAGVLYSILGAHFSDMAEENV